MVERGERADDAHHGVGQRSIVVRRVGQMLDLAHHVVTEEAHHPALQRRQVGHDRRVIGGEDGVERSEHPSVERDVGAEVPSGLGDDPVAQVERGHRRVTDEAVTAPALAMLDRLEQEPLAVAHQLQERRHRRLEVGQQFGPHGNDRVLGGQSVELVAVGPHTETGHDVDPNARKKHEYSPVWHAPLPSCSTRNNRVSPSQS